MRKKLLFALVLSAVFIGCETNSLDGDILAPSAMQTEITVDVGFESTETRMSVTPDTNNEVWAVEWEQDDQITGWCSNGSSSAFSMVDIADDANYATFTGEATVGATMRFIYPCEVDAVDSMGVFCVDLSSQAVDMSDPYMAYGDNNMYMLSDAFAVSESTTAYPTMHHLMAGMELAITPNNLSGGEYVPYQAVITGLSSSAEVSFVDGSFVAADGTITLSIANGEALTEGEAMLLPFSVVPFTTNGDEMITIELHFTNGAYAQIVKSGISAGLEFKAGEHSTMNISFDASESISASYMLANFSATMELPQSNVWIVTDAEAADTALFRGLKDALEVAYNADREIKVVFPNLTEIPAYTFDDCVVLTAIDLPLVTTIEKDTFHGCTALSSVDLPLVTTIKTSWWSGAFRECTSLTTVKLPSATYIGYFAFYGCTSLTSIDAPLATTIGSYSFYYCSSLTSVEFPLATTINGFSGCTSLTSVDFPLATTIESSAFYGCTSLTSVDFPLATTIKSGAFSGCTSLTSVDLPLATTIEYEIFNKCSSLTSITLGTEGDGLSFTTSTNSDILGSSEFYPENIDLQIKLGTESSYFIDGNVLTATDSNLNTYTYTFKSIRQLLSIDKSYLYLDSTKDSQNTIVVASNQDESLIKAVSDNSLFEIVIDGKNIIVTATQENTSQTETINGNITITVGEGDLMEVIDISVIQYATPKEYTLADFSSDMEFPASNIWIVTDVEAADSSLFRGVKDILDIAYNSDREICIMFPNLTELADYAFYSCSTISAVKLPEATTIGDYAFYYSDALTSVELPKVTMIGKYAFYDSNALTTIELPKVTMIGDNAFYYSDALTTIELPKATTIGDKAFGFCSSITAINLPMATTIGYQAFASCYALISVDLPAAMTIEDNAFSSCSALASIKLPVATTIGDYAFASCSALTSVELPAAKTIEDYAFSRCSALASIKLPVAATIGDDVFYWCSALTSVELPAATTIGEKAFYLCSTLTSIELPAATTIGNNAFSYCSALTSVELPMVTTVEYYIFNNSKSLTSIILGTEGDGLGLIVSSFYYNYDIFGSSTGFYPENIDLQIKLSAESSSFAVEGDVLTATNSNGTVYTYTFKSIAATYQHYLNIDKENILLEYATGSQDVISIATSLDLSTVKAVSDNTAFEVNVDGATVTVTAASDNTSRINSVTGNITITAGEGDKAQSVTIVVTQSPNTLLVGDIYNDGVDKGVIWWVADDSLSCKILAIEEGGDYKVVYTTVSDLWVDGCDDYYDGEANTAAIRQYAIDTYGEDDYYTYFPILEWIDEKGEGWYLPAYYEYTTLLPMYYYNTTYKAALALYDDTIRSEFYWSSTISTASKAWAIKYLSSTSSSKSQYMSNNTYGRYARRVKLITLK